MSVLTDNEKFAGARFRVLGDKIKYEGFTTYSERSLHKIIKLYLESEEMKHEIKYLDSVADILNEEGVYEVQTRALGRLCDKLKKYLDSGIHVSVVYPMHSKKIIRWIDENGEISPPHHSSKRASIYDAAYELYNIREFLARDNLSVKLIMLNSEEYRRHVHKKIGKRYRDVERVDCIPCSLENVIDFNSAEDYLRLLPAGIGECFSATDINHAIGKRFKHGYSIISILSSLGLLTHGERMGRKIVYKIKNKDRI